MSVSQVVLVVKNLLANAGDIRDTTEATSETHTCMAGCNTIIQ